MYEMIFALIAVVVLAIQVVLCLKCHKMSVKFIPVAISVLCTIGFFAGGMIVKDGWSGAGLWIFGVLSLFSVVACGLGWLIAAFVKKHHATTSATN